MCHSWSTYRPLPAPEFLLCVCPATPESNNLSGLFLPTFHVHRPRHGRAVDYLISIDGLRGGRMFHGSVCTSKSVWGFGSATPEASPVSLSFSWGWGAQFVSHFWKAFCTLLGVSLSSGAREAQPTVTRGVGSTSIASSQLKEVHWSSPDRHDPLGHRGWTFVHG